MQLTVTFMAVLRGSPLQHRILLLPLCLKYFCFHLLLPLPSFLLSPSLPCLPAALEQLFGSRCQGQPRQLQLDGAAAISPRLRGDEHQASSAIRWEQGLLSSGSSRGQPQRRPDLHAGHRPDPSPDHWVRTWVHARNGSASSLLF